MDNLKITTYLIKCADFEKDPENTKILDEINDFISQIQIRSYIPLKEKELIIMDILNSLNADFDAPGTAAFLEMGKTNNLLLKYCINVENDMDMLQFTYSPVDLIHQYGLFDAIMEYAQKDYETTSRMLENAINASNIYRLVQTSALYSEESFNEWKKSISELETVLSSDTLREFVDAVETKDESSNIAMKHVRDIAVDYVNKEYQKEEEKFENILNKFTEKESGENNGEQ